MKPLKEILFGSLEESHYRFGEFLILHRVESGQLAHIFKAMHDKEVYALKRQRYKNDANADAKLANEAYTLSLLKDQRYFPKFFNSGVVDGYRYILMEFIHGLNLRDAILLAGGTGKKISYPLAAWITAQICHGLDHLHKVEDHPDKKLIHGDVKPQNVMLGLEGEVKLIDLTLTGMTAQYAPRERVKESKISDYSDIFATGHVLYELLHGKRLESEILLVALDPNLPKPLSSILAKSLDQNSNERYKTIKQFLGDLENFISQGDLKDLTPVLSLWVRKLKTIPLPQAIRHRGHLLKTDTEGFLINECSLGKIDSYWREAVNDVRDAYIKNLSKKIHSIYLRGSVPRGEGIEEVSDIDSFAVVYGEPREWDMSWIQAFETHFKKKFPFVTYVEFRFVPYEKIVNDPEFFIYRFIIKVLSVCIYGEDLSPLLPRFKPTLPIAFAFHGNVFEVLKKASQEISRTDDSSQIRRWCAWVMKRLLRTGFGLVMEKENTYTRDLYPCYKIFSKYYPEKEPEMKRALEWAVAPLENKTEILNFLDTFGTWLGLEARHIFSRKK